jgi:hypothetical protein
MNETLFDVPVEPKPTDNVLTPAWVFDALDLAFDLDPCGSLHGDHVPAKQRYTIEDDGLAHPWGGRVWLNPPFSNPKLWVERFIENGNGVMVTVVSRAYWCLNLWAVADAVAFPHKPFGFTQSGFLYPIMFAAYGEECVNALRPIATPRSLI